MFLSEIQTLSTTEQEGDSAAHAYVLCKSCMWVLLKAVPCLWQPAQLVIPVALVQVWVVIHAQLCHGLKLQTEKQQPSPSARLAGDPAHSTGVETR